MPRPTGALLRNVTLIAVAGMATAAAFALALFDLTDVERVRLGWAVFWAVPVEAGVVAAVVWLAGAPVRRALVDGASPSAKVAREAAVAGHRVPAIVAVTVFGAGILASAVVVQRMIAGGAPVDLALAGAAIGAAGATLGGMLAYALSITAVARVLEALGPRGDVALRGTVRGKIFVLGFGLVTLTALVLGPTAYVEYRRTLHREYLERARRALTSALSTSPRRTPEEAAELVWRATGATTAVVGQGGVSGRFGPVEAPFETGRGVEERRVPGQGWLVSARHVSGVDLVSWLPEGPLEMSRTAFGLALAKVALLVYLSCGLLAWLAARAITMPFRTLGRAADRIASGDLTASPPSLSRDEMGQLAADFRRMAQGLKGLVVDVQSASEGVSLGAREAAAIGERVRDGALDQRGGVDHVHLSLEAMDESIGLVSRGLGDLSEYVSGTTQAVGEMATSFEEVRRKGAELERAMASALREVENLGRAGRDAESTLGELEGLASHAGGTLGAVRASMASLERAATDSEGTASLINELAQRAGGVVEETVHGIEALRGTVSDAHRRITALGRRSDDVDQVVDFIAEVAGRTNLLSLNASIIASQAGEHGKAFAVVADQIRELATQIGRSTKSIGEIIHSLRDEVEGAAALIDRSDALAVEGVQLARGSLEALGNIQRSTSGGIETAGAIRAAVNAHGNSAREVSQLVESVADGSRAVAQAVQLMGRSVSAVNSVSKSVNAMADQVAHALEEQSGQGKRQLESLARLERMIAEISRAVDNHDAANRRVHEALQNLAHTAGEHEAAVQGLSGVADRLGARARALAERVGRFRV
jgi:methyl-accepting chemotaxis protein